MLYTPTRPADLKSPDITAATLPAMPGTLHAVPQHGYLARPAEPRTFVYLIIDGWVARYRLLSDGRRQIIALHLPGDLCDLSWLGAGHAADHYIAVAPTRTARIAVDAVRQALSSGRTIGRLLWDEMRQQNERLGDWMVNLGRKNAIERIAYLFCELAARIGRVSDDGPSGCNMPLTQIDIADAAGLTPVHVNRVLQEMRATGLIQLQARRLKIPDFAKLSRLAVYRHVPMPPGHSLRLRSAIGIVAADALPRLAQA